MTKIELIKELKEDGIFEITQDILDTIDSDDNTDHAEANRNLRNLINRVHQMHEWTQFDWQTMLDLTTQAYGFNKYLGYSNMKVRADISEDLEDLHRILWVKFVRIFVDGNEKPAEE